MEYNELVLAALKVRGRAYAPYSSFAVGAAKEPAFPCGACRQVLAEFNPSMQVIAATVSGEREQLALDQLLPRPLQNLPDKSANV